ncbi:PDR/VanB family oxidoreductase [Cupriavidus sp. BIS7]|uniref:PDR/VanB family oxidoreductase n=1 Tax=Cupriavidus sp. BIS7 TaxID=1217718 RepID=UPI0012F68A11|nr:PDR/VanB family oxidoreductase [Cupriavidus sp. BIS7]
MDLAVTRAEKIAAAVHVFEFRHPEGHELPPFTAGAHLDVTTPSGAQRKYSLCNDPAERDHYVIAVMRDNAGRGGSVSMADQLHVGDVIGVRLPRNDFALDTRARQFLFIAGGIGITPILSMMRHLQASGQERFKLIYCTRSPEETAFLDELKGHEFHGRVKIHHDFGDPERHLDLWPILENPGGTHVYCCGPRALMDAVRDMSGHWPGGSVHFESFGAESSLKWQNAPFAVTLARSGKTIDVPAEQTLLEALRQHDVQVPSSCESGTCGSCKTRWLGGVVEHRDLILTDDERLQNMMVCVSRGVQSNLILDL